MQNNEGFSVSVGEVIDFCIDKPTSVAMDISNPLIFYVMFRGVKEQEIEMFQSNEITLGLNIGEDIQSIVVLQAGLAECEVPINVRGLGRSVPTKHFESGTGYPCAFVLVDSEIGVVKSIRVVGLGTEFSNKLSDMLCDQANDPTPLNLIEFMGKVQQHFKSFTIDQVMENIDIKYVVGTTE